MNKWCGIGRLASDPDVRYTETANGQMAIVRFNLATDRRSRREGQPTADFHSCVAFGKTAEFIDKWFSKGNRIALEGTVQNNNYADKDGVKHYGYQIVIDNVEFCESVNSSANAKGTNTAPADVPDGFINIPEGIDDEGLPFN